MAKKQNTDQPKAPTGKPKAPPVAEKLKGQDAPQPKTELSEGEKQISTAVEKELKEFEALKNSLLNDAKKMKAFLERIRNAPGDELGNFAASREMKRAFYFYRRLANSFAELRIPKKELLLQARRVKGTNNYHATRNERIAKRAVILVERKKFMDKGGESLLASSADGPGDE